MSNTNERSGASTGSTAWISVSDRLPPANVEVFVAAFTPSGDTAFYSSAKWRMTVLGSLVWEDEDCVINYPTHWMPIPPPPTKSDQPFSTECRDPDLLAAEVRRLQAVVASLQPCTLTDRERFVLREVRDIYEAADDTIRGIGIVSVIDGLLDRTKEVASE